MNRSGNTCFCESDKQNKTHTTQSGLFVEIHGPHLCLLSPLYVFFYFFKEGFKPDDLTASAIHMKWEHAGPGPPCTLAWQHCVCPEEAGRNNHATQNKKAIVAQRHRASLHQYQQMLADLGNKRILTTLYRRDLNESAQSRNTLCHPKHELRLTRNENTQGLGAWPPGNGCERPSWIPAPP